MRLTVDLPDLLVLQLRALAKQRGERGYSKVLAEVVNLGLEELKRRERNERLERGLAAIGSITGEEGEAMARQVRWARDHCRTAD